MFAISCLTKVTTPPRFEAVDLSFLAKHVKFGRMMLGIDASSHVS